MEEQKEIAGMRMAISICIALTAFAIFIAVFPDINPAEKFPENFTPQAYAKIDGNADLSDAIAMSELLDFAPLFIVTKWNYASKDSIFNTQEDSDSASSGKFESMGIELLEADFKEAENNEINRGKRSLLNSTIRSFFTSFGRSEGRKIKEMPKTGSFKLVDLSTGETVLRTKLNPELASELGTIAEFDVFVSDDYWVSTPLLRESSGNEAADAKLSSKLDSGKLLKGVKPGNYKAIFIP